MPANQEHISPAVAQFVANECERLREINAELSSSLREVTEWFGLTKFPLDQWEDLAEEFRKETGYLRPGKDIPAAAGWTEEQEAKRDAVWKQWSEKRRNEMIAKAKAALAAVEKMKGEA